MAQVVPSTTAPIELTPATGEVDNQPSQEPSSSPAPDATATPPVIGAEPDASETPDANAGGPIMGAEPTVGDQPASGSLIAYAHEGNIWLLNPVTGETRRATGDGAGDEPAWTADRRSLLFVVRSDEDSAIYTMPVGDSDPRLLVDGPDREMFPAAAPNGDIYYVRHVVADDISRWEIVRYDAGGEGQVVYTLRTGLCAVTDLQVSDTRWMLALGCGRGTAVMVGELAGGEGVDLGQQLGSNGGCLYGGAWSRVAPQQLFVLQSNNCDPASAGTITSVDMASGTPATEPTYMGSGISSIDASPDGRELVFAQAGPSGTSEGLWVVGIGGQSVPRQLVAVGTRPAWRP